jgi:hypothetical protein
MATEPEPWRTCPGHCGRPVRPGHFACRDCWYRLPTDLRQTIVANYRRDPDAHMAACMEAITWYREQEPVQ